MDKLLWREGLLIAWACWFALMDYRQRRLPNSLTLGATGIAVVYLAIQGRSILGAPPFSTAVAGIGVVFLLSPCLWLGWLGAGDIKLMSAIGFIGGIQVLLSTFVFSSFLALPVVLWFSMGAFGRRRRISSKNLRLPQGVFIALGFILTMFSGIGADSA